MTGRSEVQADSEVVQPPIAKRLLEPVATVARHIVAPTQCERVNGRIIITFSIGGTSSTPTCSITKA